MKRAIVIEVFTLLDIIIATKIKNAMLGNHNPSVESSEVLFNNEYNIECSVE